MTVILAVLAGANVAIAVVNFAVLRAARRYEDSAGSYMTAAREYRQDGEDYWNRAEQLCGDTRAQLSEWSA